MIEHDCLEQWYLNLGVRDARSGSARHGQIFFEGKSSKTQIKNGHLSKTTLFHQNYVFRLYIFNDWETKGCKAKVKVKHHWFRSKRTLRRTEQRLNYTGEPHFKIGIKGNCCSDIRHLLKTDFRFNN